MTRAFRTATEYLFVLTEAVGWYIAICVIASMTQQGALNQALTAIESGVVGPANDPRVYAAAETLREALEGVSSGPSVIVIVVSAFAAFFLSRYITQLNLARSFSALLGIVGSVLIVNVLLHVVLSGDLRFWEGSGFGRFIEDPQGRLFAGQADVEAFVENPDIDRVPGASVAMVVFGFCALWIRFVFVGRGSIHFDRALRSFTIGFPVVMTAVVVAQLSGVASGIYAVPYFVLGMMTLAVANGERSAESNSSLTQSTPWAMSAMVTVGSLTLLATGFGLMAALEVEQLLAPLGTGIGWVVRWALVIVLTPVAWLVNLVITTLMANADPSVLDQVGPEEMPIDPDDDTEREPFKWPKWITAGFRLAAFAMITVFCYYAGRYLFFRQQTEDVEREYVEQRASTGSSGGIGNLLGKFIPRARTRSGDIAWLERHDIYKLFSRAMNDAKDRGFEHRPGETPLEFASLAESALDAPSLTSIAGEFDRVRYGRHQTLDVTLRILDRELSEWEASHPVTDEIRAKVARDVSVDDGRTLPPVPPDEQLDRPRERPEPGTLQ